MSLKLVNAQDHIILLGRKTAYKKIASFLLMLLTQAEQPNSEKIITLPMTRTDIGDYTGLAEETVSRVLTRFRKLGYIKMPTPGEIHITDAKQLDTIVNGTS
ncbi:MAG: helix-turn-helix domain-containing protein [Parvibaculum sp.]